jgi:hypothetical protein
VAALVESLRRKASPDSTDHLAPALPARKAHLTSTRAGHDSPESPWPPASHGPPSRVPRSGKHFYV